MVNLQPVSVEKQFANRKSLNNHKSKFKDCKALYTEERQSDPTKVTCIYCGKKYKDRKNVQNHVQQVEYCKKLHEKLKKKRLCKEDEELNDKKEFECQQCKTKFVTKNSLQVHCSKFKHK